MIGMADDTHNMDGVMSMGIMNALRTGNPQVDMVIALCLPFALNFLITSFKTIFKWAHQRGFFASYTKADPKYESRVITHKTVHDEYGDVMNVDSEFDTHNSALIKAVRLYLYNVRKLRLKDADIDLMINEDKSSSAREFGTSNRNTLADHMSKYAVVPSLPKGKFYAIGKYGDSMTSVELNISENKEREDNNDDDDDERSNRRQNKTKESVVQYHFRSEDGSAVDDFLVKAYEYYLNVLRSQEDHSRYLFELKVPEGQNNTNHVFKRYRLSEEKTFASLFFREKDSLLTLIDNFMSRSGRYSIAGYPHKLGILLHGPPGTGKTSLIKSLAQYTGRSIINVPLSRISTNTELMSIFYSNQRSVEGQYAPTTAGFKDVIYVMEDVDSASKIVKRRDGVKVPGSSFGNNPFEAQPVEGKSIFQMFVESKNQKCVELVSKLVEKAECLKEELHKADTFKSVTRKLAGLTGLGYVGEAGCNPQLKLLAKDALGDAKKQAEEQEEVDSLLEKYAQTLLNIVEKVDKIDDELVDELLNKTTMAFPLVPTQTAQKNDEDDSSLDSLYLGHGAFGEEKKDDKYPKPKSKFPLGKKSASYGRSFWKPPPDALNLQGLLNVLDGVVDSPGRIIIMTTNHPEALDPALIRPGRVDKKLFLAYMAAADVISMLEHYFQTTLDSVQRRRIEGLLAEKMACTGLQLVPAQLEQMTTEFESVDELIETLQFQFKAPIIRM